MPCFWCFFKTYQIHSNPSCWFWVRSPVLNKVIWCGTHPVFCCASSSKSLISMPLVTSVMPSSHTKSILLWQYGNYGYYGYYWLLLVTNLTIDTMVTMVSGVPPKYANGPMVSFFFNEFTSQWYYLRGRNFNIMKRHSNMDPACPWTRILKFHPATGSGPRLLDIRWFCTNAMLWELRWRVTE